MALNTCDQYLFRKWQRSGRATKEGQQGSTTSRPWRKRLCVRDLQRRPPSPPASSPSPCWSLTLLLKSRRSGTSRSTCPPPNQSRGSSSSTKYTKAFWKSDSAFSSDRISNKIETILLPQCCLAEFSRGGMCGRIWRERQVCQEYFFVLFFFLPKISHEKFFFGKHVNMHCVRLGCFLPNVMDMRHNVDFTAVQFSSQRKIRKILFSATSQAIARTAMSLHSVSKGNF